MASTSGAASPPPTTATYGRSAPIRRKGTDVAATTPVVSLAALMALSRRSFLAVAAAGLAACSKSVHKVVGSTSTTAAAGAAPATEPTTTEHSGPARVIYSGGPAPK